MSRNNFSLWRETLPNLALLAFTLELRRQLRDCRTVLDLGCGTCSPMRLVNGPHLVGVDGHEPSLRQAQSRGTHDEYHLADVRRAGELFGERRFDACVALDVIEHLPKADGWQLLEVMERLATRRVIVVTPNGFVPQHSRDGDLQEHLSGWLPEEFRGRGYAVLGLNGPKALRGEYAALRYRPKVFWGLVSFLAHCLYTRRHAERAFTLFCVRKLG